MTELPEPAMPPRRRARWYLQLLWLPALALLLLGVSIGYLANPRRAASLAEGLLQGMTGARIDIDTAHFGFDGKIELNQVVAKVPNVPDQAGLLFEAERVLIEHNVWSLIIGQFRPTTLHMTHPVMYVTEDLGTGKFNFQILQEQASNNPSGSLPMHLPEIYLPEGRVQFSELDGQQLRVLSRVACDGQLTPDRTKPLVYDFKLVCTDAEAPMTLRGHYRPLDKKFEAELDRFTVDNPHRNWLPRKWRQWWDEHEQGPGGTMQRLQFGYDIENNQFYARLEFENVNLIPPVVAMRQARMTMTGGSGTFTFNNDGVTIENLRGTIENVVYQIDGHIGGLDSSGPFKLTIQAHEFTIPQNPRYLTALPESVRHHFLRFNPTGKFSTVVSLERTDRDAPVRYHGYLSLHNVSTVYEKFAYPLMDLQGKVRFDNDAIEIVGLTGRGPTGAKVTIDGKLWPPGPHTNEEFTITATNVPLFDDALYLALPKPQQRTAYQLFLDKHVLQSLVDVDLVQRGQQQRQLRRQLDEAMNRLHDADAQDATALEQRIRELTKQINRPVFDLGGRANVTAKIMRTAGAGSKRRVTTTVDLAGINALYRHWPYPLQIVKGTLTVAPGRLSAEAIEARTLDGDGRLQIDGEIVHDNGRLVPNIKVTAIHLPLNRMLAASIPPAPRITLDQMGATGTLDGRARIWLNDRGKVDFEIDIKLDEATARPFSGRIQIDQLVGEATLRPGRIQFKGMTGHYRDSRLSLSGTAEWREARRFELQLKASQLRFQDPLFDLIPPTDPIVGSLRKMAERYQPKGVYDLDVWVRTDEKDPHQTDYRLELHPKSIELQMPSQRIALSEITGMIVLTPDRVDLQTVRAEFDEGSCSASGQIRLGPDPHTELIVSTRLEGFEKVARAVLPSAVIRAADQLNLNGTFQMDEAKLDYRPQAERDPVLSLEGTAKLTGASAIIGVPITDAEGDLELKVVQLPGEGWPTVSMQFDAKQLRIAERLVSPLSVKLHNRKRADTLAIENLQGLCYDGTLFGTGNVRMTPDGFYRAALMFQDVRVGPFLKPETSGAEPGDAKHEQGRLSARINLEARHDDPLSRRGRGRIDIHQASLYEVPLALAVLQIINLSLPSSKSFDEATAEFVIDGDSILFDRLLFKAPNMQVSGTGKMHYRTHELDLDLVSINPTAPNLGHLSRMLEKFKDELVSIHVNGSLSQPKAHITSLRGTQNTWHHIFGKPNGPDQRNDLARPITFGQ